MKCAQVIVADQDLCRANPLRELLAHGASTPGLWATEAAYSRGEEWLRDVVAYLHRSRTRLSTLVTAHLPGVRYVEPDASYLAWLDFRETRWADDPARYARTLGHVITTPGTDFGKVGGGFLRLNFATSYPVLEEMIRSLGGALRATPQS